ncbi:MAG: carbohydrate kinase [Bacteroidaceae bacterium]|nr:carbohydrate kinase [Bacteroidaceae bacterium]MBR5612719.1 carbohydrate kinase [Bacteroidaceae bacterium]
MRRVIGIGETILDILFKDNQPKVAVPGGSVFNGIISLGRAGANVTFISEVGGDKVGNIILDFMKENGVGTDNVVVYPDRRSPVSLAFLNEKNDAEYIFYKDYPNLRLDVEMPEVTGDDIIMFGSFYAITPQLRDKVKELLDKARKVGAIIYYDVNFRKTHAHEAIKLMPTILENFEYADIVRGSNEDFGYMFGMTDPDKVYQHKVSFYCPRFICTNGGEGLCLRTATLKKDYPVEPLQTVSTIGAGDNFNAGLVFGLLKNRIRKADLDELTEADWDKIIASGMSFSKEVCTSLDNYISKEFAASL